MQEFIAYLIKNLVENPDDVSVNLVDGGERTLVEVRVAAPDIGKVVGKQGRTIKALRTIALALGARMGRRVSLELLE